MAGYFNPVRVKGREDEVRNTMIEQVRAAMYNGRLAAKIAGEKYQTYRIRLSRLRVFTRPMLRYHSDEEILDMGERYHWNIVLMSEGIGISRHAIDKVLRDRDLLQHWGKFIRRDQHLAKVEPEVIVNLYEAGYSLREIGKKFGVSSTCVGDALKRAGVERRSFEFRGGKHEDVKPSSAHYDCAPLDVLED